MPGYRSDINLRLGQMPEIKDNPPVFNELQQIYNAIHLLNSALNQLNSRFDTPDRGTPPWESFTPENRMFWAPASNDVKEGDLVKMEGSQFTPGIRAESTVKAEIRIECDPLTKLGYRRRIYQLSAIEFGLALEDASEGLALIGWPEFIIEVTGIPVGELAYGRSDSGTIFSNAPDSRYYPVGRIVAPDALLLMHNMKIEEERKDYDPSLSGYCQGATQTSGI